MNKPHRNGVRGNRWRRHRRKQWLLRRARRRFLNPRYAVMKPRTIATRWGCVNKFTKSSVVQRPDETLEIELPAQLDFEENYETTASHFRLLRNASLGRFRIKELLFDEIKHISPAAALVLASEVDRWNQRVGGRLRATVDRWNSEIKRLLGQMGYFELLGLKRPDNCNGSGDINFLHFLRGESGRTDGGKLAKQLRIDIETLVGKEIQRQFLFEGLSEAITNVSHHAYPPWSYSARAKQWWLSASFEKEDRRLNVMFYDQGVGIPKTLPSSHLWEHIKGFFDFWTDAQKIQAAMEYGRSATGRPERGKGLKNLLEFAKAHAEGKLSIYSHSGLYRMVQGYNGDIQAAPTNHETPIGGTLIEWSVKL